MIAVTGAGEKGGRGVMSRGQAHVTAVMEEYLRAILDLGMAGRPVIGRRLADWLGVAPSTVTATLQRMGEVGLVSLSDRKEVLLSKEGAAAAIAAARRHHLSERLLTDYLHFDWARAHAEAERWQHTLTEETERLLWEALGRPTTCPHGNPIPGTGACFSPGTRWLRDVREGEEMVVERIAERAEADVALLQFFARHGIVPESVLQIDELELANGTLRVTAPAGPVALGLESAGQVLVRPKESMPLLQFHVQWQDSRAAVNTGAPVEP
ncbi:MAG TPA: metal-dependent transcriptional regulator [Thermomicrobiales bacterium]|nr:metal-dependent transcriptional regulator [Thermomicrobiales bacterium]